MQERRREHVQGRRAARFGSVDRRDNVLVSLNAVDGKLYAARARGFEQGRKLSGRVVLSIGKGAHAASPGQEINENLLPFAVKISRQNADPRRVCAWPGKRANQPGTDHIIRNRHDGNACSCGLRGPNCGVPAAQNRIRTGAYEIGDDGWKLIVSRIKASPIDGKTLPLDISLLPQLVEERSPSGFR